MISGLIETIISELSRFIIACISRFGYSGILLTMAIESACIPLPSEIIMPFSGYLVTTGQFTMLGVTLAGAVGNVVGSIVAYVAGIWGGRPFVERYGPYFLVSHRDLDTADRWFQKYGEAAVFFSRMLPVVRTFISLPAGIAQMNFPRFVIFTFVGALPWCYLLAYIGVQLGEQWEQLREYFHRFDLVIGVLLAGALAYFIWSHWPKRSTNLESGPPPC
ncbi:MAG: DedA family protein [Nitrospiraceae bacterium]